MTAVPSGVSVGESVLVLPAKASGSLNPGTMSHDFAFELLVRQRSPLSVILVGVEEAQLEYA
eukprot:1512525-Heterocapsa_arctica.AAC.1